MAKTKTKPADTEQPATKQPASKEKPATKRAEGGVGIKELAADLGSNPKSVRARIRRFKGGAQVGQGGRYNWASKSDPEYKALLKELTSSNEES